MTEYMIWLFIINTTILIMHEIDAAYWKEWKLFRTLGEWKPLVSLNVMNETKGLSIFVWAHLPLFIIILYALVWQARSGSVWPSLTMSSLLIIHYLVHRIVIRKGRLEFTNQTSKILFQTSLIISVIQLLLSLVIFYQH